jgi:hypothetical protein
MVYKVCLNSKFPPTLHSTLEIQPATLFGEKCVRFVEGEKTGDGISYASHVKNPYPLKARATTFYDPVHNALDKEAQCAWKEGEGSHWPSVYIQKPFMTL